MVNKILANYLAESSIHGLKYIITIKHHVLERIFWFILVLLSAFITLRICLDQWNRFKNNPIVLAVELIPRSEYYYPAHTVCLDYIDEMINDRIIERKWNVTKHKNIDKYEYYMRFLKTLDALILSNLDTLTPFQNDPTIKSSEFVDLLLEMLSTLSFEKFFDFTNLTYPFTDPDAIAAQTNNGRYARVMTENGLCLTTSTVNFYQNPIEPMTPMTVQDLTTCKKFMYCSETYEFNFPYNIMGFHEPDNVYEFDTFKYEYVNQPCNLYVEVLAINSEQEIRKLPINYRKCRYNDENNLKYFREYKTTFCKIECRIQKAMDLCNCKPFFYVIGPELPLCGIDGLLCLSKTDWYNTKKDCDCLALCESVLYIKNGEFCSRNLYTASTRSLIFKIPNFSQKKRVVFSIDQLVVSFGGAASFFLGCNFLSFVEIFYFLLEILIRILKKYFRK